MGFEIGFRTHRVCLCGLENLETVGACVLLGPHHLCALVEVPSLWTL